ncbi:hypothetical protein MUG91_G177n130 [Manis pentadactyla]|nr:hypothetical protein MUG91_G177n130 [Manis pentadactyla]
MLRAGQGGRGRGLVPASRVNSEDAPGAGPAARACPAGGQRCGDRGMLGDPRRPARDPRKRHLLFRTKEVGRILSLPPGDPSLALLELETTEGISPPRFLASLARLERSSQLPRPAYAGLSGLDVDPSLPVPNVPSKVLEDNLDAFSLYSGEDRDSVKLLEKYADPASQASLQDLRLGKLQVPREADEGGRATSGSAGKEEQHHTSPQNPLLDCSLCGKVFSRASSLSKHYLTHSQERKHVCGICSKAFKRKDHLTGHMLTHQKTKPFACREQGCSKSYCDDRSLRRHYKVQPSLCVLKEPPPPKEEACGDSSPAHEVAGQPAADGLRSLVPPEARSPGPLLPNREPLRSIVSSLVHQEISSPSPVLAGPSDDGEGKNTACPSPPSLGPYPCTPAAPGTLGTDVPEECHPLWKEPAAGFTAIHSRVAEDGGPHPAESERPPQLPPTLESGQEAGPSVDPPQDSKPKLMISNRIQSGNTYRLPDPVKEESMSGGYNQQNGGPADWAEPRSTYVCKNCSQMFYTEEGLTSYMCLPNDQWLSPRRKQDQQVKHGVFQASMTGAEARGGGTESPRSQETLDGMSTAPLMMPASESVGPVSQTPGSTAKDDSDKVIGSKLGSDVWTSQEKILFNKAFQAHKKNFHLIHKMVQTKTVAQCAEYYYTWKRKIRFAYVRAPGLGNGVKRKLDEADRTETKATCSPQKRPKGRTTPELKMKTKSCRGESVVNASPNAGPKQTPEPPGSVQGRGTFPCRECERVFDKIQSRNAHMRQHWLQDPMETTVRAERPAKAFLLQEEEKEEEGEMGADMGPLQG